jgi:hypothetical protein
VRRSLLFASVALTSFVVGNQVSAANEAKRTPEGIVWASIRFNDRTTFAAWLSLHGITYRDWSRRHPLGAYLLTHPAPLPFVPAQPTTPDVDAVSQHTPRDAQFSTLVLVGMVSLAALLVVFGAAGNLLVRTAALLRLGISDPSGARVGAASGGLIILVAAFLVHSL